MPACEREGFGHRELHGIAEERVDERPTIEQRELAEMTIAHDLEGQLREPFTPRERSRVQTKQALPRAGSQPLRRNDSAPTQPVLEARNRGHTLCLGPLSSLADVKLNIEVSSQFDASRHLDRIDVKEHIRSALVGNDEPEPLVSVKQLDAASLSPCHPESRIGTGTADQHHTGRPERRKRLLHASVESLDPAPYFVIEPYGVLEKLHDVRRRMLARRHLYEDRATLRHERRNPAAAQEVLDKSLLALGLQRG